MKQAHCILIADDDFGHRNMLRLLLEQWGYQTAEAKDGEEAVQACQNRPFDLLLMDVRMPRKSGLEALTEIRAMQPHLPILIMTAFSNVEDAVAAIKDGAYDYLTKPLDFDKLKVALRNVFEHRQLQKENAVLAEELAAVKGSAEIIGHSQPMRQLLEMVRTIAPSEATVLISGESGTGKELIAKAIYQNSHRSGAPYIAVNCAAIAESLLESELFGHEKGAFTSADRRHEGYFKQADGGTIFLDEVGEMSLPMQAKLLRVLQEREVQRVGGSGPLKVDVRIIAASNRDLQAEVAAGNFREDLFYRLNVVSLHLPPLRDRIDDIPLLAQHFLSSFAVKNKKNIKGITPEAMNCLLAYAWPGNVRELENVMERAVVLLIGEYISPRELPGKLLKNLEDKGNVNPKELELAEANFAGAGLTNGSIAESDTPVGNNLFANLSNRQNLTLDEIEKQAILETLKQFNGNKSETAKALGIARKTLHTKLAKYEE